MHYWLFTTTHKKVDSELVTAEEMLQQRLADGFWGLGERTPNRRSLHQGDRIVCISAGQLWRLRLPLSSPVTRLHAQTSKRGHSGMARKSMKPNTGSCSKLYRCGRYPVL